MRKILLFTIVLTTSSFVFSQENTIKTKKIQVKTSTLSVKKTTSTTNTADRNLMADTEKKEKYVKYSSSEFRTKNNIPSDFPKYKETGDLHKDTGNYDVALKQWIRNNEEKYNEIKDIINF